MNDPRTREPLANPTPAQRFRDAPDNIRKHRDMIDSHEFQRAADFAMLEYQVRLTMSANPAPADVIGQRITGALEFLQVMRFLGEVPQPVAPRRDVGQLNHEA